MRLQPFLEIAHRSVEVFSALNKPLMSLYSLVGKSELKQFMPVIYSFLNAEFSMFSDMAQTNDEVKETLLELCCDLEAVGDPGKNQNELPRKSIIDPSTWKISGYHTRSTSAKVNHTSVPPSTKNVDAFQVEVLHRSQRGKDKRPKRHKCPVCQREGHHARTCQNIILQENAERADTFLKRLFETQKIDSYISSIAKRQRHSFVEEVLERIKMLSASVQASNERP